MPGYRTYSKYKKGGLECNFQTAFLYNENPQLNWGFKKLKAMGRKK